MKGAQGKNSRRTIGFGAAVSALIVVMGVSQPSGAHANASGTAVSAAVTALRTTFSELAAVDAAPVIVPNAIRRDVIRRAADPDHRWCGPSGLGRLPQAQVCCADFR